MDKLIIILIVLSAILWVWAIFDINKSRIKNNTSIIWLILILIVPIIGPIIYFLSKRSMYKRKFNPKFK